MPPSGRLPQERIDAVARWVMAGAPWPKSAPAMAAVDGAPRVTPETRRFWSFQPIRRPPVPRVQGSGPTARGTGTQARGFLNPIDAFVLARLQKSGLKPNPPAPRAALLRRVYYDLIGLPPSPEEVRAFLGDASPAAYERVVDRLLASPRYGEKWGRHWLDLVRFAETNSYERDGHKPDAWRYRDYVIDSLNRDKPFDQFIVEQLAGDELPGAGTEQLIATGFYRLGLWDDEPVDPKQALYDELDDVVSTTGQVFLGLTLGCARCHDHKIDPIPQKDYYRFLAFFNGVTPYGQRSHETVVANSLRPIAAPEVVQRHRQAVEAHQQLVKANAEALAALEQKAESDFSPVEREEFRNDEARPQILKKRVGSVLTQGEFDRYLALRAERAEIARRRPPALDTALCVTEVGPAPRETRVFARGNPHAEGEAVAPGFPSVLGTGDPRIAPPQTGKSSGRRLALAQWIASPGNPLTARVIVNRIWQHHFGRGIVRTPSNFGFQGARPTHPELLDWLASELVHPTLDAGQHAGSARQSPAGAGSARAWSLKRIHRLIVTSRTYRMSSSGRRDALSKDPENDLLWRFDPRRLQAEEVRDSVLAVTDGLNLKAGGPSFYPDIPAEVLAGQSMPGAGWGKSSAEEQRRRSVYIYVKRSLITPIIASFDGPDTDFTCPVRFATTQPTQALGMLNSEWINEQARVMASSLRRAAPGDTAGQVRAALWRVMQRPPAEHEVARGVRLIGDLRSREGLSAEQALARFCVVALNLNEFLYLD